MAAEGAENESASRRSTQFATTHWSTVLAAGDSASPKAVAALERLCRSYWYPLYAQTSVKRAIGSGDDRNLKSRFIAQMQPQSTPRAVWHEGVRGVEFGRQSLDEVVQFGRIVHRR